MLVGAVGLTALATAFVNLTTPRIIGELVNILSKYLQSGVHEAVWLSLMTELNRPALLLFGLFLGQGILTFAYITLVSVLGERVAVRLKMDVFRNLLRQDVGFFDSTRSSDLSEVLSTDVADFKHSFKLLLSQGLKNGMQVAGSIGTLFWISPKLTAVLMAGLLVGSAVGNVYGGFLRRLSRRAKDLEADSAYTASEALANIKTVRACGSEESTLKRYERELLSAQRANVYLGRHIGVFQGTINSGIGLMILAVLYFGGGMVARHEITGGDLMSYLISIQNAQRSISQMSVLFAQSLKAWSSFGRIHYFCSLVPSIPYEGGVVLTGKLDGRIEFRNVNFTYPSRPDHPVLREFNLNIPAGKMVALCGESGAGKSTLGALIERFYEPQSGQVLIDGSDIREIDPRSLREHIGYIHQEPVLFGTSILENIRYAKPDATVDEVIEVAKLANAHEFISRFPQGYETTVGERGAQLSGGQKQRIAIARAFLRDCQILIADEATSSVDTASERIVQEAMDRLMKGRTVIVIAHRLSTIENADKIVVLARGGRVLEEGTHHQLLQRRGAYFQLYNRMSSTSN